MNQENKDLITCEPIERKKHEALRNEPIISLDNYRTFELDIKNPHNHEHEKDARHY